VTMFIEVQMARAVVVRGAILRLFLQLRLFVKTQPGMMQDFSLHRRESIRSLQTLQSQSSLRQWSRIVHTAMITTTAKCIGSIPQTMADGDTAFYKNNARSASTRSTMLMAGMQRASGAMKFGARGVLAKKAAAMPAD
jgi:hypothetical protein